MQFGCFGVREGYTSFELEMEKAELIFSLLAQLFEDQGR